MKILLIHTASPFLSVRHARQEEREKWQKVIADKDTKLADKDAKLADKDAQIAELQAQLEKHI